MISKRTRIVHVLQTVKDCLRLILYLLALQNRSIDSHWQFCASVSSFHAVEEISFTSHQEMVHPAFCSSHDTDIS